LGRHRLTVHIENDFTVQAPIDRVWAFLLDVEKVAPCMPGAELTEVVDDRTWKGKTNVKVGPVSLSFAGTVVMEERDDVAHRCKLAAKGMEQRGKGAASAAVVSHLEEVDGATKVSMETDLTITGAVAQYGRGMMQDISQRLTREFAQCLEANILAGEASAAPPAADSPQGRPGSASDPLETPGASGANAIGGPQMTARPVKGFRLGLWAFWRAIVRFFKRLFGAKTD
jgi:carbon monoxide dehydrogenase subunit G